MSIRQQSLCVHNFATILSPGLVISLPHNHSPEQVGGWAGEGIGFLTKNGIYSSSLRLVNKFHLQSRVAATVDVSADVAAGGSYTRAFFILVFKHVCLSF